MANNPRHLRPTLLFIDDLIAYFAQSYKEKSQHVRFIQVGANDGRNNDPIHTYIVKYGWEGILVEPQKYVFENELSKTYEGFAKLHLENVAISKEESNLPFYRIAFSNARWATGLASFDRASLDEHIDSGYVERKAKQSGDTVPANREDYLESVPVSTATFEELILRHHFKEVDLLCVDTEGYDFEVLRLFDFAKFRPKLVLFESKNLCNRDFIEAKEHLIRYGYKLFWYKGDTVGIKFKYPYLKMIKSRLKAFLHKL